MAMPLLLAEWIAARNALRRHSAAVVAGGIAIAGALVVVTITLGPQLRAAVATLLEYRVLTMAAVGAYAALQIAGRRRETEACYAQFWLAAAPIQPAHKTIALIVVSLAPLFLQLLAVCILLLLARAFELTGYIAAAISTGVVVGWFLGRPHAEPRFAGSRYVAVQRATGSITPSSVALSRWPLAQVRAWGRPENFRVLLVVALFAVQGGSSAIHGLSVVAIWLVGGYLSGLLSATLQTASAAAAWLRSTPISFMQFAWSVSRRALLYQALGTVFGAALMTYLGAPGAMTLYFSALWLSVVVLACSVGLAQSYRSRTSALRLAVSFATLAAIEVREHAWSIPLAAVLAAWHLRAGAKS